MSADHEDAQVVLERKALSNVRALVEKLEREEASRYRGLGKELAAATLLTILMITAFVLYHRWFGPARESAPRSVTLPHVTAPPPPVTAPQPPVAAPHRESPGEAPTVQAKPKLVAPRADAAAKTPRAAVPVEPLPTIPVAGDASCKGGTSAALRRPVPTYPRSARVIGQEGWVILDYDVDEEGIPTNLRVVAASPKGIFESSIVKAMRQVRYPADQRRTGCRMEFIFRLTD